MSKTSAIPKIIHQLWIGPKPRPSKFMDTWKEKHPDFEYIWWSEQEIAKRGLVLECQQAIDKIEEINGKADIIRWEILYQYGGIFLDADSICVEPFDDDVLSKIAFAGYENELNRPGLVATGTMGFPRHHPLCRAAINYILSNPTDQATTGQMAWQTVGPLLLTRLLDTGRFPLVHIFPSYTFLPIHYTSHQYEGHGKVYAYQEWGSTKQNYDIMNTIELPAQLRMPPVAASVLITSYDTKFKYICECLDSIKAQNGHFAIELVWVNDGSSETNTALLEKALKHFQETTRFVQVKYIKMETNRGQSYCSLQGLQLCTNEIVFRMDSDDIMLPERMRKQWSFLDSRPDCMMCGTNLTFLRAHPETGEFVKTDGTQHPERITLEDYRQRPSHWMMNHPTICFRKSAVMSVGSYSEEHRKPYEDFELELKMLRKYGVLYNLPESLLLYRIHPGQLTFQGKTSTPELVQERNSLIQNIIFKSTINN